MKKHSKKIIIIIALALLIATPLFLKFASSIQTKIIINQIEAENERTIKEFDEREEPTKEDIAEIEEEDEEKTERPEPVTVTPVKEYLNVPFICQAPLETEANWVFHEESCEEAALLQSYLYETGNTMTKEEANTVILDMIDWQNEHMGGHLDLYADEMREFIKGYYNLEKDEIKTIYGATIEDIKSEISSGHPVIAPVMSGLLTNPYYPYPGYHMLLVTGYTEDKIITNDNGTKRGKDFSYDIEEFKQALEGTGGNVISLRLKN